MMRKAGDEAICKLDEDGEILSGVSGNHEEF
jgi:hypothetical protein